MCTSTRLLVVLSAVALLALCVLHYGVLPYYDHRNNAVIVAGPYAASHNIREFHKQAFVADMHADSLLWGRDLRERQSRGHVDLPRLSDGGVPGTCPGPRNLSDDQLRGIAGNGGVIGIAYFKAAVCDTRLEGITAAILYAIKVAGVDHVGLGSDFDGNVATPFDVTGLPMLTQSLFAAGLSGEEVGKVLGGNVRRVLAANLPE